MNVQPNNISPSISLSHRVETVDFARGIAALGVMLYHLLYGEEIAAYERVAYYFVYAFFIISGFALYISNKDRAQDADGIRCYAKRRVLRIAPLFIFACLLDAAILGGETLRTFILNVTLVFGFANPGTSSMIIGGWSIGIEVVFYFLFPMILIFTRGSLLALGGATVASIWIMFGFTSATLEAATVMTTAAWQAYTQPIAFIGYFMFGCLLGEVYLRHHWPLKGRAYWWGVACLSVVIFASVRSDNPTGLLKGGAGVLLMVVTMTFVTATAFLNEPVGRMRQLALWLGSLSYPIYLLHPIVYFGLARRIFDGSPERIIFTLIATIGLSITVHLWLEKPILRLRR